MNRSSEGRSHENVSAESSEINRVVVKPPPFWQNKQICGFFNWKAQFDVANINIGGTTEPTQLKAGVELRPSMKDLSPTIMSPPILTGVEATLVAFTPIDQESFLVASIYIPPNPNFRSLGADSTPF
ncbi:hypothetical protein TNCT_579751 [Trichonephila clavata]|uniref:Uncharacterized protein n=1 Tax=Trichonephila clavata TaxID=2740835 RepID=A0A8X6JD96_TRICU|nr:hypothetical protein TNCT_579751 [Trichonephila clavata]